MKESKYLEKVILIFKTKGLSLSMDEIANYIGVTKKTLYNRFESKDELIRRCMVKVTEDVCSSVSCMNNPEKNVKDCFKDGINALRSFFREMTPVFFNDMLKSFPLMITEDHQMGSKYFVNLLKDNIERGKSEKVYRQKIDSALMADYIAFSIFAYFRKSVMMDSKYSADYYFRQVIEFNLNALSQS
jgi:AcrR family transcriptional regulator